MRAQNGPSRSGMPVRRFPLGSADATAAEGLDSRDRAIHHARLLGEVQRGQRLGDRTHTAGIMADELTGALGSVPVRFHRIPGWPGDTRKRASNDGCHVGTRQSDFGVVGLVTGPEHPDELGTEE